MAQVQKYEVKQRIVNVIRGLIAFIALWSGAAFIHASTGTVISLEPFALPLALVCAATSIFTVITSMALYKEEE